MKAATAKTMPNMEILEKRAKAIAAMNLVTRDNDRFRVATPSLRGRQQAYEVWRDENAKVRCSCLEYEENSMHDSSFRCEHILAVKFSLLAKNTEPMANQPAPHKPVMPKAVKVESISDERQNAAEAGRSDSGIQESGVRIENKSEIHNQESADGNEFGRAEQEQNAITVDAERIGRDSAQNDYKKSSRTTQIRQFADKKEEIMNTNKKNVISFAQTENANNAEFDNQKPQTENANNVLAMPFTQTLQALRQNVDSNNVKQREGWRDRNGNVHMVDYVEWHTVADILDRVAPNWSHTIRDIKQIGDFIAVTAAITIDGVTREGVGTGAIDTEMGIKKAEHDALKRAAVKFGIARELYKRESDVIETEGSPTNNGGFPSNPIAKSLADLVTGKQLGMIRALSRDLHIEADEESQKMMNCKVDELSKRAASSFIQHLQTMSQEEVGDKSNVQQMRRAG
ncbi:MAG: SWIM zinc finger family protein [Pyrinomonadaceae bacterium]|nr:SWIM zinc finger family protein [Pyrinomonadaceae bacterium]